MRINMDNSSKNNKITENEQQLIDTVAKITDNYRNSELLALIRQCVCLAEMKL